jgi:large subunit ribosomal protein L24e
MTVDSTLTFAARRNVPVRYNRELVATTLNVMRRVEEIRLRRERVFYRQRVAGGKQRSFEEDRKLVEENQHLLPPEERYAIENELKNIVEDEEMDMIQDKLEEEFSEMDFEEEKESEEEIEEPVIKSRLPKAKQQSRLKMTISGGVEKD